MGAILMRRLQLLGHIRRLPDYRLLKTLMLGIVESEDDLHGGGLTSS